MWSVYLLIANTGGLISWFQLGFLAFCPNSSFFKTQFLQKKINLLHVAVKNEEARELNVLKPGK